MNTQDSNKEGFLGDRVGQTFTEEDARKEVAATLDCWDGAWRNKLPATLFSTLMKMLQRVAATLQPKQTMGRELTEAEALKWITDWAALAQKPYEGHWEDLAYWLTVYRNEELAKGPPAPSHPVEGELTKEWLNSLGFKNPEITWNEAMDAAWSRILSDQAATEARVRNEMGREFRETVEKLYRENAALTAKLETSVQIPPFDDSMFDSNPLLQYPGKGYAVYGFPTSNTKEEQQQFFNLDTDDGSSMMLLAYIPRPTPKTMTNEEKAEAVLVWYMKFNQVASEVAKDVLIEALSDGKSIDELYAQVKGE